MFIMHIALALFALTSALAGSASAQAATANGLPAWARDGVCYEVFVRSFYDSDGDGVGDLQGLTEKLDYINDGDPETGRDLGANCIWLMPVAQSPSYHGYDVTNYYAVDRDYGTNEDFKRFVAEAHQRGIRILVDLGLNHSSSDHPYFKSTLLDPASPYRDWYLWSPTQRQTQGWMVPTWHKAPSRDEYYYGLFWHGMPDLNLANPEVRAEAEKIGRFWLEEMGVDGFRLDAVMHFFEDGDDPRHGPGTHPWLRDYAAALQRIKPDVFTIGEVWDSTGALVPYYPDQLSSYFAFEVSDGILNAVRSGSSHRLFSAVQRAQRDFPTGRWSPFLRNHDQTRTLTELGGDTAAARLATTILLTLPGVPFVYYGEEIGMTGSKPDPRLRTPMHWRRGPAAGFTTGVAWEPLQPDSMSANVEVQDADPGSLLNLHRKLIHLRSRHPALGRGTFVPLAASEPNAMAYLRQDDDESVLVLANLGDKPLRGVTLSSDGPAFRAGRVAAESLYGGTRPAALRIGREGSVRRWIPISTLGPREAHIIRIRGAKHTP